jgi:tetratricopeptide (TPR) repeat protein
MDIGNAYELAKEGRYEDALAICNGYIINNPNDRVGYKKRSFVFARMNLLEKAISDCNLLISLGHEEPDDYFSRGRWYLEVGNLDSSINDFTKVTQIENGLPEKYYTQSAYFHRAYAQLKMGLFQKAIEDCENIKDDYQAYIIDKVITKADIFLEAQSKLCKP